MATPSDFALAALALNVGRSLRRAGLSIATAESCTGGLIAKCLTDIAGSSDYFERGWVTYSNAAKRAELGVSGALLGRHGAVSEEVAMAMARGALRRSSARVSIAVTGVAGPAGGTPDKPVGTVWIAWGLKRQDGMQVYARRFLFRGSRNAIRRQTAAAALEGLPAS
ncbi:MAG TPA: CinA family protein [Steroidobacteraceae bacterium]|nr:CinA family protein [Steroidobacteraceae bacterium]